jgi:hypothetical protein
MSHTCHAHGCEARVPPAMFACKKHWFALRRATRLAVWREYRPGQEDDKHPSLRYLAVQRFAVGESAFKPHDEAAVRTCAQYMLEAQAFRQKAIDAGLGDPLEGLVPAE